MKLFISYRRTQLERVSRAVTALRAAGVDCFFDLEDIEITLADDERTLTLAFVRGEQRIERAITLHHPIYRGIYKQGDKYSRGDTVTWGGSTWIAMRDTDSKPETDDSWRLSVKRGRDGKDGAKGDPGQKGRDGKDSRMGAAL